MWIRLCHIALLLLVTAPSVWATVTLENLARDTLVVNAEKRGDFEAVGWFYYRISMENNGTHNYPVMIGAMYRSIENFEKATDKRGRATAIYMLGDYYKRIREYDKAFKYILLAAQIKTELRDTLDAAVAFMNCGDIRVLSGDPIGAEPYIRKGALVRNSPVSFQPFYYYFWYGRWLKALHRYDEARVCFEKALPLALKGGQMYQKAAALCELAEMDLEDGNQEGAGQWLKQAGFIDRENGFFMHRIRYHRMLSRYYEAKGNPTRALKEYKLWEQLRDSLKEAELQQALVSSALESEFKTRTAIRERQQQVKDEKAALRSRRQQMAALATGGATLLLGFLVFMLYRNNRQQEAVNALMVLEQVRSESLLNNILPHDVATDLKSNGSTQAKNIQDVTVLFTDFKNFTLLCELLNPQEVVNEINYYFSAFDNLIERYGIEKIKTIGDSYMCAGGLPVERKTGAIEAVFAAMDIRDFMEQEKYRRMVSGRPYFEIRIGLHTGPVAAGIVGIKKFAYDLWGDTVNIASRMESSGEPGKINISGSTYELVKDRFTCQYRGKVYARNIGPIDMFFVEGALR